MKFLFQYPNFLRTLLKTLSAVILAFEAPFIRPKNLSKDSTKNNDAFLLALKWVEKKEKLNPFDKNL